MGRREMESRLQKQKKITIREVAKRAGVSPTTVSNVLHRNLEKVSESTAKRVRKVLDEMGYEPIFGALILAGSQSHVVCVLVGNMEGSGECTRYQTAVYQMLGSLEKEITQRDYYMLLHFCDTAKEGVRFAFTWNAEGMITIGIKEAENSLIQEKSPVPLAVLWGGEKVGAAFETICEDIQGKARMIVKELLDTIHEKRKENKVAETRHYTVY